MNRTHQNAAQQKRAKVIAELTCFYLSKIQRGFHIIQDMREATNSDVPNAVKTLQQIEIAGRMFGCMNPLHEEILDKVSGFTEDEFNAFSKIGQIILASEQKESITKLYKIKNTQLTADAIQELLRTDEYFVNVIASNEMSIERFSSISHSLRVRNVIINSVAVAQILGIHANVITCECSEEEKLKLETLVKPVAQKSSKLINTITGVLEKAVNNANAILAVKKFSTYLFDEINVLLQDWVDGHDVFSCDIYLKTIDKMLDVYSWSQMALSWGFICYPILNHIETAMTFIPENVGAIAFPVDAVDAVDALEPIFDIREEFVNGLPFGWYWEQNAAIAFTLIATTIVVRQNQNIELMKDDFKSGSQQFSHNNKRGKFDIN